MDDAYLNSAVRAACESCEDRMASGGTDGSQCGAKSPPADESSKSGSLMTVGSGSTMPSAAATPSRSATRDIQLRDETVPIWNVGCCGWYCFQRQGGRGGVVGAPPP